MLLEAQSLKKSFKEKKLTAVDGISLGVERGRTLGILGESGSGKSTLVKLLLGFYSPEEGRVLFDGKDVARFKKSERGDFHKKVQVVFQEPYLSLDPRLRVRGILAEPFFVDGLRDKRFIETKVAELLRLVGLPAGYASKLPRQLSGGECQRVAIARALARGPELLICDEPVSSLDVLVRAQILDLLLRLQSERGMAYIFISHDIKVVRHMSDDILVMKDGRCVEVGARDAIFEAPKEAYTRLLIEKSL